MSRYLYALGRFSYRRRWLVLVSWLALLGVVAAAGIGLRGEPSDDFSIPGTESQQAVEQLKQKLPAFSGAQTQITFAAPDGRSLADPALAGPIDNAIAGLGRQPDIAAAAGPSQTRLVSPDGRVGLVHGPGADHVAQGNADGGSYGVPNDDGENRDAKGEEESRVVVVGLGHRVRGGPHADHAADENAYDRGDRGYTALSPSGMHRR